MTVLLVLATIADLLLAVFLIAVSGFFFGSGPEGGSGASSGAAVWAAGMAACLGAPIIGFVLRHYAKPGIGVLIAIVPPGVGILMLLGVL